MAKILLTLLLLSLAHVCSAEESHYVQQLKELAEQGNGESQFALALLFEQGEEGLVRDPKKAATLFLQAGKAGIPAACLYLGIKHESGSGVTRNLTEAAYWYCCAATKNWAMAQFLLANLYEKGRGVEKNKLKALAWYELANEQGYPAARESILQITAEMTAEHIEKAQRLRTELLSNANCSEM
jgi:TPR repeat protein